MNDRTEQLLNSYIPMSEQSFLMLLSLLTPRHGYAIMQLVSEESGGRITLSPSTVYTILYKMEQDGLIKVVSEVERRKIYSITSYGKILLETETKRLESLSKISKKLLKEFGGEAISSKEAINI